MPLPVQNVIVVEEEGVLRVAVRQQPWVVLDSHLHALPVERGDLEGLDTPDVLLEDGLVEMVGGRAGAEELKEKVRQC